MNEGVRYFINYLFAWTIILVALSCLLSVLYPFYSKYISKTKALDTAFLTLLYGLLAPILATFTVFFLAIPDLSFPFIADHCHNDNCKPHHLHVATDTLQGTAAVTLIVVLFVLFILFIVMQLFRNRIWLRYLNQLSHPNSNNYRIVENAKPMAWCTGLLKPQVFCTTALVQKLDMPQFQSILVHEMTHAMRRDNLRKSLLYWSTIFWFMKPKKSIRQTLSHSHETIADVAASRSASVEVVNSAMEKSIMGEFAAAIVSQRRYAVERELGFSSNAAVRLYFYQSLGMVFLLCLIMLVLAIHFGHPLLEVLGR